MSFESKNPTTGELLQVYPEHSADDVQLRLQSAWDGWKKWSSTPLSERTAFLLRLADLLEKRAEEYARLITLEMGKPIGEALGEVKKAAFGARHFAADGAAYIQPEAIPGIPGSSSMRRRCKAAHRCWKPWFEKQVVPRVSTSIFRFKPVRCRRLSRIL